MPKVTTWLIDDIGLEWGLAYPEVSDPLNHREVHDATNKFIDHEPEEDRLIYQVNMSSQLLFNIGVLDRGHWYLEMWGPAAEWTKDRFDRDGDDLGTPREVLEAVLKATRNL